jgi:apolipoprotein N-acyltransferase
MTPARVEVAKNIKNVAGNRADFFLNIYHVMQFLKMKTWLPVLIRLTGAVIHGVLLASAFPPYSQIECAWVSFIPILLIAYFTRFRQALLYGIIGGFCFWLISLWWLLRLGSTGTHIALAFTGWIFLSLYCALYTGIFVAVSALLFDLILDSQSKTPRITAFRSSILTILLPVIWVGLEYIRSTVFTGFPWNTLGITQYRHTMLIQIADIGGVYTISALLLMFNTAITLTALDIYSRYVCQRRSRLHVELMIALAGILISLRYGAIACLSCKRIYGHPIKIALVQPNIPQLKKWPPEFENEIYARLEEYTEAVLTAKPDLVIFPETALPSILPAGSRAMNFARDIAQKGSYLLVGVLETVDLSRLPASLQDYDWLYNSSFLFDTNGNIVTVYRKIHLVPFGEYLPLDKSVRLVRNFTPLGFSCMPGKENTIFHIPLSSSPTADSSIKNIDAKFAVLICFEDTMAYLARQAVRKGAMFLVNQTNDAWFDNSPAAVQHLSHSVFRAVENKVPVIRCANTGVSCFIDHTGKIDDVTLHLLQNKSIHIGMHRTGEIWIPYYPLSPTLYTKYGDWLFAIPCTIITFFVVIFIVIYNQRAHIHLPDNHAVTDKCTEKTHTKKE